MMKTELISVSDLKNNLHLSLCWKNVCIDVIQGEFSSKWRKFIKCCRNIQTNTCHLQGAVKYRGIGILETGFFFLHWAKVGLSFA